MRSWSGKLKPARGSLLIKMWSCILVKAWKNMQIKGLRGHQAFQGAKWRDVCVDEHKICYWMVPMLYDKHAWIWLYGSFEDRLLNHPARRMRSQWLGEYRLLCCFSSCFFCQKHINIGLSIGVGHIFSESVYLFLYISSCSSDWLLKVALCLQLISILSC